MAGKHRKPAPISTAERFAWTSRLIEKCVEEATGSTVAWAMLTQLRQQVDDGLQAAGTTLYTEHKVPLVELAKLATASGWKMTKQTAYNRFSPTGQAYQEMLRERRQETARKNRAAQWREFLAEAEANSAKIISVPAARWRKGPEQPKDAPERKAM